MRCEFESPPSRAAWIEMLYSIARLGKRPRRRLHGRRGLKFWQKIIEQNPECRRLHGRRGLKFRKLNKSTNHEVAAFTGGVD